MLTVGGNGSSGFSGDGGPATSAMLSNPQGIAVDANGNVYFADINNNSIRKITAATGVISTVAGTGSYGFSGDGGPATAAMLDDPDALAIDASGDLYIGDSANSRIRKINMTSGTIFTIAGTGTKGYSGDGGPATSARVSNLFGITVAASGEVFYSDDGVIRKLAP